jgi:hypothetical protein
MWTRFTLFCPFHRTYIPEDDARVTTLIKIILPYLSALMDCTVRFFSGGNIMESVAEDRSSARMSSVTDRELRYVSGNQILSWRSAGGGGGS